MTEMEGPLLAADPAGATPTGVFVSEYAAALVHSAPMPWLHGQAAPAAGWTGVERVRRRKRARTSRPHGGGWWPRSGVDRTHAVPDRGRLRVCARRHHYALAQGNYVELRLPERSLLLRETMNHLALRLDPRQFLRIHRSRIVRIDLVDQVQACGGGQYRLRLRDGTVLASGRSYRASLLAALGVADAGAADR